MTFQTKHSKIDVALLQLDSAIKAHMENRYIEAITLAGASEEILGAFCKRQGLVVAVEEIAKLPVMKKLASPMFELNRARNCLKHAKESSEDDFEIAQEDDYVMIVRAIVNLKKLKISPSETVNEFRDLYKSKEINQE